MPFVNGIKAAREKIVARTDDDRSEFLRKRGFSKTETALDPNLGKVVLLRDAIPRSLRSQQTDARLMFFRRRVPVLCAGTSARINPASFSASRSGRSRSDSNPNSNRNFSVVT